MAVGHGFNGPIHFVCLFCDCLNHVHCNLWGFVALKAPKVSLSQFEQEIDLGEFFEDVDFSRAGSLKDEIAQAIIDLIVSRTEAGDGIRISANGQGRPVKLKSPYSDEYEKSLPFKAAGKSKNKVNMTLTGDMLASVEVLQTKGNKIKIGIADDDQIPKAYNHQVGDTVPERPWFGISKDELDSILGEFEDDIERLNKKGVNIEKEQTHSNRINAAEFIYGDDEDF